MRHVVCIIHRDCLTIERNNREIGTVREINGQPTILLYRENSLTQLDTEIIWDNWNAMQELGGVIEKSVDLLPEIGKLSA